MKQIIKRVVKLYNNGCVDEIYYLNNNYTYIGNYKSYYLSGKIMAKRIRINDKIYGLEIWYDCDGKIKKQKYYL